MHPLVDGLRAEFQFDQILCSRGTKGCNVTTASQKNCAANLHFCAPFFTTQIESTSRESTSSRKSAHHTPHARNQNEKRTNQKHRR
jgi:hypothetical protein